MAVLRILVLRRMGRAFVATCRGLEAGFLWMADEAALLLDRAAGMGIPLPTDDGRAKGNVLESMMEVEKIDGGLSALTGVLERHWRIDLWIASWLDVICGLISVVTLTYFRPMWDFDFRCWSSKRRIRNMMSSNDQGKGQTPQAAVPLDPPVGRDGENK